MEIYKNYFKNFKGEEIKEDKRITIKFLNSWNNEIEELKVVKIEKDNTRENTWFKIWETDKDYFLLRPQEILEIRGE